MDELIEEFLLETYENLAALEDSLERLEYAPNDGEALNTLFRHMHMVKGSAMFVSFKEMEAIAHEAETMLAVIREGQAPLTLGDLARVREDVETIRALAKTLENTSAKPVHHEDAQSVHPLWEKMTVLVEELSGRLGKPLDIDVKGSDTPVDVRLMNLIKDPVMHLIRNCADHGIEDVSTRQAAGKPETGRISLNAFLDDGMLVIEVADDGAGLNTQKIAQIAVEKRLVSEQKAASMKPEDIHTFIFTPGFSTAGRVTTISGHGVGMDVAFRKIKSAKGCIEIHSQQGVGARFVLRLPTVLVR